MFLHQTTTGYEPLKMIAKHSLDPCKTLLYHRYDLTIQLSYLFQRRSADAKKISVYGPLAMELTPISS